MDKVCFGSWENKVNKNKFILMLNLFLSFSLNAHEKQCIPSATAFPCDLKHKGYFEFKDIQISNYYEIKKVINLDINRDGKEDYLLLLVPKSITPPLSDDFDFENIKFYKRKIVEIISSSNCYVIGKSYNTLITNSAGMITEFDDINVKNNDIEIIHSKPNGKIYWEIRMHYHYIEGQLSFFRLESINNDLEVTISNFENVAAENINIFDFIP